MRSSTLSISALAAGASALPSKLTKRDWENDPNGNVILTWSDETIQIGTVTIDDIMGKLGEACATTGQCDTKTETIDGQLIGGGLGGSVDSITVSIDPSGAYPTWIRNGLLDILAATVKEVAKCEDTTQTPTCPNPAVYCPAEPYTVNQCTVPKYWGVNYQSDPNAAPPFIGADIDMQINESGFCDTFTTIGSAVAGAVSGIGGGIFSLASLACK